jgi:hypothetical protein
VGELIEIYRKIYGKLGIVRIIHAFCKKTIADIKFMFVWPFAQNKLIKDINFFDQKYYSQNGEDGILKIVFHKIGTTDKFCVEFGVEDGRECNTRYLIEKKGWNYLHMDADPGYHPFTHIKKEFITAENINLLFKKYKVPKEFDLLSIDLDYNTYWVYKSLKDYKPRVLVVEYNASFPPTEAKAAKYEPNKTWDGTDYYGASLLAYVKLAKKRGYTLVGCDKHGVNAFFIREDLIKEGDFLKKDIQKLYRQPYFGIRVNGRYIGHPPSKKKFISV